MDNQKIEQLEVKIAEMQALVEKMKNGPKMQIIPGALYDFWDCYENHHVSELGHINSGGDYRFSDVRTLNDYKHCRLRKNQLVDIPDDWITAPPIVGNIRLSMNSGWYGELINVLNCDWGHVCNFRGRTKQVLVLDEQPELKAEDF